MKCALQWVTYAPDLEWFKFSAASYSKFATGFIAAKCYVPNTDVDLFFPVCAQKGIELVGFDEIPGKGFLHHLLMQCMADLHSPEADAIAHIDADAVFTKPVTPQHYMVGGKLKIPFIDFAAIQGLGPDVWQSRAETALGFPVVRATMTGLPIVHYSEVYRKTREVIKAQHGDFFQYVLSQQNEWPQGFCEFETLGGIAHRYYQEQYIWHNLQTAPYDFGCMQSHSVAGIDEPRPYPPPYGNMTPREYFLKLGL